MMIDDDTKLLIKILFPFALGLAAFFVYCCAYEQGKSDLTNELCNRQQYDFCVVKQEWGIKR